MELDEKRTDLQREVLLHAAWWDQRWRRNQRLRCRFKWITRVWEHDSRHKYNNDQHGRTLSLVPNEHNALLLASLASNIPDRIPHVWGRPADSLLRLQRLLLLLLRYEFARRWSLRLEFYYLAKLADFYLFWSIFWNGQLVKVVLLGSRSRSQQWEATWNAESIAVIL